MANLNIEEFKKSEWSPEFEKYMRNRLIMGAFRYGKMADQELGKYNLPLDAKKRIDKYLKTKNLEHLVDAANILLLQFVHGKRIGEELKSIDDGEHSKEVNK